MPVANSSTSVKLTALCNTALLLLQDIHASVAVQQSGSCNYLIQGTLL